MAEHRIVLDAFADARRTWEDVIALQPDVPAAGDKLTRSDLEELARRVEAHRAAIDMLADALETEPQDVPTSQRS
jgi:hypothetical protein